MGFGSYDESEQQRQNENNDVDMDDSVRIHENDHEGKMRFETGASTGDLLSQLNDIKDSKEPDE